MIFCLILLLGSCVDVPEHNTLDKSTSVEPLVIAVASNFYLTLKDVIKEHPSFREAKVVTGSSGTLYAQAINGAPFDLFIAADDLYPTKLFESEKSFSPVTYAFGKLVIFPVRDDFNSIKQVLKSAKRIAIANPETAPYGKAAELVLSEYGMLMEDIVIANNVSQAFQFADTGNVNLSFVSESLLIHAQQKLGDREYFNYLPVPESKYPVIRQQLVILSSSRSPDHAQQFIDFLLSSSTQKLIEKMGYYSADSQVNKGNSE